MNESSTSDKAAVESLTAAPTAAPPASKRTFTVIRANAVQNKLLLDAFEQTHITTPARLEELEKETGLTKKWISSWFTRQRKKVQQTAAAARATTTTSTEVASSVTIEQPSDASTLRVKKEVYESVISAGSAIPPAPKKKRQRKSAPGPDGTSGTSNNAPTTKKRKVDTAKGPSSGETSSTTSTTKSSGSIFDKLKVKAERYTPGPEERPASTVSTSATYSDAGSHIPLHALLPLLQDPRLEATGVFAHGSTYSSANEILSISDSVQARRASSPSAVAMKSRRQRVQYAGEGPVLNTRFMHHGLLATDAPSPGMPTRPMAVAAASAEAYQEDKLGLGPAVFPYHQLLGTEVPSADGLGHGLQPVAGLGGGSTRQYAAQPGGYSVSASLPNRIAITRIEADRTTASANGATSVTPPESQLYRGAMASAVSYEKEEEEEESQNHYLPPVLVDEVDTFDFQPNAASWQMGLGRKVDSSVDLWATGTGTVPTERPTSIRNLYTNAPLGGYPQYTDFLDPLHAPLKHLTEILDPICSSSAASSTGLGRGGYEALLEFEGRQRQVVMEKLLDEDLGVNDPFKAAMGLVLTSKMGLQW